MKATIPIGVQPGTKLLHLEWEPETSTWCLWTHFNRSMKHGTFLRLDGQGGIEHVTIGADGLESIARIK